jgi:hypothetical protein
MGRLQLASVDETEKSSPMKSSTSNHVYARRSVISFPISFSNFLKERDFLTRLMFIKTENRA